MRSAKGPEHLSLGAGQCKPTIGMRLQHLYAEFIETFEHIRCIAPAAHRSYKPSIRNVWCYALEHRSGICATGRVHTQVQAE
jgi:hypothetical protein